MSLPYEYNVTDGGGSEVGWGANLLVEDSSDNDYNDAFVSIIAWKTAS